MALAPITYASGEMTFGDVYPAVAVGAITMNRFCVKVAGGWSVVSSAGGPSQGISTDKAADKEGFGVMIAGVRTVEAGAAVTDGADVMSDNQGRAIPYVAAGTNQILGTAFSAAGAAGQLLTVFKKS